MDIQIKEKNNTTDKKVVGTQINQSMYEQLKYEAEKDFMSISDLLRKIIYLYYRNKNNINIINNAVDEKEN